MELSKPSREWGPAAAARLEEKHVRFAEETLRDEHRKEHIVQDELFLVRRLCALTNRRDHNTRSDIFVAKEEASITPESNKML